MLRLPLNHNGRKLRLDQRPDIPDQFLTHISPVIDDPLQRNFLLDIGHFMYIIKPRSTDVGLRRHSARLELITDVGPPD